MFPGLNLPRPSCPLRVSTRISNGLTARPGGVFTLFRGLLIPISPKLNSTTNSHRRCLHTAPRIRAFSPSYKPLLSLVPFSTVPAAGDKGALSDNSSSSPEEPRLSLTFTCTAPVSVQVGQGDQDLTKTCDARSSHTFTRRAYERGVVLVQCPECQSRHLIADHLGWFSDATQNGALPTIEDIVRARGEDVRRGRLRVGGGAIVKVDGRAVNEGRGSPAKIDGLDGDVEFYE